MLIYRTIMVIVAAVATGIAVNYMFVGGKAESVGMFVALASYCWGMLYIEVNDK